MTEDEDQRVNVPNILKIVYRAGNIKIWAFLRLNPDRWFTSHEISKYLEMPLSTVQFVLKKLGLLAPRIVHRDKPQQGKGRPEKEYKFEV